MLIMLKSARSIVWLLFLASVASAAEFTAKDRQPTPEELATLPGVMPEKAEKLIKDVKVPAEFEATIFATPPAVNYPVFVAAAPDGTLYVSTAGHLVHSPIRFI